MSVQFNAFMAIGYVIYIYYPSSLFGFNSQFTTACKLHHFAGLIDSYTKMSGHGDRCSLFISLTLCLLLLGTRGVPVAARTVKKMARALDEEDYGSFTPPSPPSPLKQLGKRDPSDCTVNGTGDPQCTSREPVQDPNPRNPSPRSFAPPP
ncbi:hypothetical protein Cni_G28449 [Canna indica]|uniref:Uncharacterized protein n=1 Tax=Canna indica TaxID=4628 RepID=A0AAQ3L2J6_9LILI|nr:hypothetical protein Cni_G28449 [Canna indica]